MDSGFINFNSITNNDLFKKLFKNDVEIYGPFVRKILIDSEEIKSWKNQTIHCYAKFLYRDIIERDLFDYIKSFKIYQGSELTNSVIINYQIEISDTPIHLEIIYIRSIVDYEPEFFESDLQSILDIDCLVINRKGIKCIELFGSNPYIFGDIIQNIRTKRFNIKNSINRLTTNDKIYIKMLKNKGYTNNNSCLIQPNKDDKHECSICYDSSDKSEYVKLKCGHIYHKKCIEEAIKIFFNSPEKINYKCPYCSKEYLETELI
tara:strand:+ start:2936 stop:3721 length:786 start_codon:yes stop_codon:yes gene_type:complete